ncbi:MAG: hypothetical protein ACRYFR_12975 [Janthinobacterium lividum]
MYSALAFTSIQAPELFAQMHFADTDVLPTAAERCRRATEAARAAILGSTYRGKLAVSFRTADGALHRLQTCVWAVDGDYLVLQTGLALPLRAVLRVEFS